MDRPYSELVICPRCETPLELYLRRPLGDLWVWCPDCCRGYWF